MVDQFDGEEISPSACETITNIHGLVGDNADSACETIANIHGLVGDNTDSIFEAIT